jgi:hypothetical protein
VGAGGGRGGAGGVGIGGGGWGRWAGAVARLVAGDARADLGAELVARPGEQLADVAVRDLGRALLEGRVDEAAVPVDEGRAGVSGGCGGGEGGGAGCCRVPSRRAPPHGVLPPWFRPAARRQGQPARGARGAVQPCNGGSAIRAAARIGARVGVEARGDEPHDRLLNRLHVAAPGDSRGSG